MVDQLSTTRAELSGVHVQRSRQKLVVEPMVDQQAQQSTVISTEFGRRVSQAAGGNAHHPQILRNAGNPQAMLW
jgi:hypothetical protein